MKPDSKPENNKSADTKRQELLDRLKQMKQLLNQKQMDREKHRREVLKLAQNEKLRQEKEKRKFELAK